MQLRFKPIAVLGLLAVLALALVVAGCGSSGSSSSSSESTTTESNEPTETAEVSEEGEGEEGESAEGGDLSAAAEVFQPFVGGTAGEADPSKSTITFGFLNDEGGTVSFPEGTIAAEVGVEFINKYLGGIEGHPIAIEKCLVATGEEQGQTCAQKFRNNSEVVATVEPTAVVGSEAFQHTMAGAKPTIIGVPNSPADAGSKNGSGLTAGVFGNVPGYTAAVQAVGAKSVSLLYPGDDPTGQLAAKSMTEAFEAEGVSVKSAGFSSKSSSFLAPAQAAGVGQTEVVTTLFPLPSECIAGAKALQQLAAEEPVISLSTCANPAVAEALGDIPSWVYASQTELAPELSPELTAFKEIMEAAKGPEVNYDSSFAATGFSTLLVATKMGNEVGAEKVSPETINAALETLEGPTPMGPPLKKRGVVEPKLPALLTTAMGIYQYEGEGKWSQPTKSKWVGE
jgi:branched-chain amino acid transport system substrate-binding protein